MKFNIEYSVIFNFMKKIKVVLGILLIAVVLSGCLRTKVSGPVDLKFYGLDDADVFDPLIAEYQQQYTNVRIKYKKFANAVEFENLIVNEIAEGEGPDIFYIHNTWLPRHTKKLVPLTSTVLTPQNFNETFVKVVGDDFVQPDPLDGNKKIYALPLYVDTLALYYNKSDFEQKVPERGKPADTWNSFKEEASRFIRQDSAGKLEHGAIAMGRSDNISLSADILYNFFLQAGVNFYNSDFKQADFAGGGQESFDYFLSFADSKNKNYSWSTDLVSPGQPTPEIEAFLSGKVSSVLAYSDLYQMIANELKNVKTRSKAVISSSDVAVSKIPQMSSEESNFKVWADYYGLAVSRNTKNATEAWDFVRFLASTEKSRFYHQKTKKPTARRDLIEEQKKEPITDVFVSQVGYAGSYRIFSDKRFAEIIKNAIIQASSGQTPRQALGQAQTAINELLKLEAPNGLYPKPKLKTK